MLSLVLTRKLVNTSLLLSFFIKMCAPAGSFSLHFCLVLSGVISVEVYSTVMSM